MHAVFVRVSIASMKHHVQNVSWGGTGLFSLHFCIAICGRRKLGQEFKQGRVREVGADGEAMEGSYLLACPHSLCSLLSYTAQDQKSSDGTTHHWLDPPHPSQNKKVPYNWISRRNVLN